MQTASVTERDHYEAQRLHATPSGVKAFGFVLVAAVFALYLHEEVGVSSGILLGACIGAVVGVLGFYFVFLPFKCARIYRQQRNLQIPFQFSWDDEGVFMKNEMAEGKTKWSDFRKYKQNKSVIMLYHSDALFNLVPKSAFSDAGQLADFMAHVERIRG
jgi:hypothetical protein